MGYYSRLKKAFEGAVLLPLNSHTKYVLFSDCHRGTGTVNDNFLKNKALYLAALQYYFFHNFTYIELGDGDELWENRHISQIQETHKEVFQLHSFFKAQGRFFMLYGNHNMAMADTCHESIILETTVSNNITSLRSGFLQTGYTGIRKICLTHGHQTELLNSSLWPLSGFLVRHIWKPLERYGISDPTSAAKNYKRKKKAEQRLHRFAERENIMLITGHTHRPFLSEQDLYHCNCGSCVHPYSITCIEIQQMHISLIKWSMTPGKNMALYVTRSVLAGPVSLTTPANLIF